MTEKPTKILRAPYYKKVLDSLGRSRKKLVIDTDAGSFMIKELAGIIGISHDTLRTRLSKGWEDECVLKPNRIKAYDRESWQKERGNAEWQQLSDKPRG